MSSSTYRSRYEEPADFGPELRGLSISSVKVPECMTHTTRISVTFALPQCIKPHFMQWVCDISNAI